MSSIDAHDPQDPRRPSDRVTRLMREAQSAGVLMSDAETDLKKHLLLCLGYGYRVADHHGDTSPVGVVSGAVRYAVTSCAYAVDSLCGGDMTPELRRSILDMLEEALIEGPRKKV